METEQGERLYWQLSEMFPHFAWVTLPDSTPEYHNRLAVEYTGIPASDIAGIPLTNLIHPDDLALVEETWKRALVTGASHEL